MRMTYSEFKDLENKIIVAGILSHQDYNRFKVKLISEYCGHLITRDEVLERMRELLRENGVQ